MGDAGDARIPGSAQVKLQLEWQCPVLITPEDDSMNTVPVACFVQRWDKVIVTGVVGAGHEAIFMGRFPIRDGCARVQPGNVMNGFFIHTYQFEELLGGVRALGGILEWVDDERAGLGRRMKRLAVTRIRTGGTTQTRIEVRESRGTQPSKGIVLGSFCPDDHGRYEPNQFFSLDIELYPKLLVAILQLSEFLGRAGPASGRMVTEWPVFALMGG